MHRSRRGVVHGVYGGSTCSYLGFPADVPSGGSESSSVYAFAGLEDAGVNPSGGSDSRHLMDDARSAARELGSPPGERKPGRFVAF